MDSVLLTLEPFGAGSVQVDVFFLKIGVGLPSFAFRVCHILMTRKNKKDFFFFTQNESKQFLLALGVA